MPKSRILVIGDFPNQTEICESLSKCYQLYIKEDFEEAIETLISSEEYIFSILIDAYSSCGEKLFNLIRDEKWTDSLVVFGVTEVSEVKDKQDLNVTFGELITKGFYDIIDISLPESILLRRMANASRAMLYKQDLNTLLEGKQILDIYHKIIKDSRFSIFEYDVNDDRLVINGALFKRHCENESKTFTVENFKEKIKGGLVYTEGGIRRVLSFIDGTRPEPFETRVVDDSDKKRPDLLWVGVEGERSVDPISGHIIISGRMSDVKDKVTLKDKAERDKLTGFYNRESTERRINKFIENNMIKEKANGSHAFCILDLDCFKKINDGFGHIVGDKALIEVSRRINRVFRDVDILGRIGGDEFVLFMKNISDEKFIIPICERLCKVIRQNIDFGGFQMSISASVGIAMCPRHGSTYEELYRLADIAMYACKARGKNQYKIYENGDEKIAYN